MSEEDGPDFGAAERQAEVAGVAGVDGVHGEAASLVGGAGKGVANAVGYAVSQKMAAAKYNTAEHPIFDNHIVALAGDGCMQEGVAMEAVAFAGHFKLDNLILIYDSNDVTLDAMAIATQSENAAKRFGAIEWGVQTVDGNDLAAFLAAFEKAKAATGKPQIIIARTLIGKGIP